MNENKKGVIYILTNPSFPEYVKIGYADDINKRLKSLNSSSAVPFGFRAYAIYDVYHKLEDKKIHNIIDSILTVKVTNKTNDKKSFSFHIEAVDSDGSRINEGYAYANDLGAGQGQTTNNITIKSRKGLKKVPLFFCVKNVFINIKKKSNIY